MVRMKRTKTVLQCNNCDPNYELDKLNPRWSSVGKQVEFYKTFVGIYETEKSPADYNEKLDQLICPFCNNKLVDTKLPLEDFHLLGKATDYNREILDLMLELHKSNPIEYQLNLNQFKLQQEQSEAIEEQQRNENKPHCPHCKSANIKSISGLNRGASIAIWGIFSKKINKSFECKSCGYTW